MTPESRFDDRPGELEGELDQGLETVLRTAARVEPSLEGLSSYEAAKAEFWQRVAVEPVRQSPRVRANVAARTVPRWRLPVIAGAVIGASVLGGLFVTSRMPLRTPQRAPASVVAEAPLHYRTAPGQRARITLADGSAVVLGVQSELVIDPAFGGRARTVRLTGEALFTVTQNEGVPFDVRSGDATVRVLGTSFSVRHYQQDTAVRVVVASGKVAMNQQPLSVGDIGVAADSIVTITRDANIATELAWTEGRLILERKPLREAILDLERWYGITVDVRDPALLDRRISTTLTTESAQQAVQLFATVIGAKGQLVGTHAVFSRSF